MTQGMKVYFTALSILVAPQCFSADTKHGPDDAAEVAGKFIDMAGESSVRERAQKEAEQKAKEFLKDKKPGEGVIIHKDMYDVPTHPDSVLKPKDAIVHKGGSGQGKDTAIKNDNQTKFIPSRDGEKTSTESIYFEKQPDNSIKQERVTRQEVERSLSIQKAEPKSVTPPAPAPKPAPEPKPVAPPAPKPAPPPPTST